jgi:hypothetical protein
MTLISWGRKLFVDYDENNQFRKYNKILLKDPADYHFFFGIPEYPSSDKLITGIQELLEKNGWPLEYAISVGYSGGGYPAILYGCLAKIPSVQVCCPTTKIDFNFTNNILLERRYQKNPTDFKEKFNLISPEYLNLPHIISKLPDTKIKIHYTTENKYDVINSTFLNGIPNVSIISYQNLDHYKMKKKFEDILYENFYK